MAVHVNLLYPHNVQRFSSLSVPRLVSLEDLERQFYVSSAAYPGNGAVFHCSFLAVNKKMESCAERGFTYTKFSISFAADMCQYRAFSMVFIYVCGLIFKNCGYSPISSLSVSLDC